MRATACASWHTARYTLPELPLPSQERSQIRRNPPLVRNSSLALDPLRGQRAFLSTAKPRLRGLQQPPDPRRRTRAHRRWYGRLSGGATEIDCAPQAGNHAAASRAVAAVGVNRSPLARRHLIVEVSR